MEKTASHATRLTIEVAGDALNVVAAKSIRMIAPASDDCYGFKDKSGFWFQVLSENGECLYRKVMQNPLNNELEAPSGDPKRSFTRVPVKDAKGRFTVLLPEFGEARELQLHSSPPDDLSKAARLIAKIDLKKPMGKVRLIRGQDSDDKK